MPVESSYPPLDIPATDVWEALFESKTRPYQDDKVLFVDVDSGRNHSYADVKNGAIDFGKGLKSAWEWKRGDVLALYTPNSIDTGIVTWGVHWAGGIVSPANPAYTVDELAFQLKDSGAKALVTQVSVLQNALEAAKQVGIPSDRVILLGEERDPEARTKHFTSIRLTGGASRYRRTKAKPEDLAYLVYSSGTTGLPKGVMLSHYNIVANVMQLAVGEAPLKWNSGPNGEGDSILAFLPMYHIYGLNACLHQAVYSGIRMIVMPRFDIEKWCENIQKHRCTFSYIVPPVVLLLAKHPIVDKYDLSSLRMLNSGAAPLTQDLVESMYARIKVPVKQGYGLSETSPTTHVQKWENWRSTVGSIGNLVPNLSAKFMSEDEKEVPVGQVGELWVKGPNVFQGYLNNPEGTRNSLTPDRWFKTGDIGYVDEAGNFYITDRVKELIKYKGFQVPPAELEGLLVAHPKIDDVAVIGIYSEDQATEIPRAYVVPAKGVQSSKQTENEIMGWLAKKVAQHKRLRGGVRFVDEIPKSASGKIFRRVLRDMVKQESVKAKL
ncbi:MAG: hypothetical protein MMC23_009560 [Stictis urceolatum]|nr:hypothetical protein [Stictis urceolata]